MFRLGRRSTENCITLPVLVPVRWMVLATTLTEVRSLLPIPCWRETIESEEYNVERL